MSDSVIDAGSTQVDPASARAPAVPHSRAINLGATCIRNLCD
jgi:hypothetical protein